MDIGQAAVDTASAHGQAFVVNAQQVQYRGVNVVDLGGVVAVKRFDPKVRARCRLGSRRRPTNW